MAPFDKAAGLSKSRPGWVRYFAPLLVAVGVLFAAGASHHAAAHSGGNPPQSIAATLDPGDGFIFPRDAVAPQPAIETRKKPLKPLHAAGGEAVLPAARPFAAPPAQARPSLARRSPARFAQPRAFQPRAPPV